MASSTSPRELIAIRRVAKNANDARAILEAAIVDAHQAGLSLRVIGEAAGVSYEHVRQIVRSHG